MSIRRYLAMIVCVVLPTLCAGASGAQKNFIWWEGEAAAKHNFSDKTWFEPKNTREKSVLSEGDWLTNDGKRGPGEAEAFAQYRIRVPAEGTYSFWTRKFWKHGPFRWRFDRTEWRTCGRNISLADSAYLRKHVGANWVYLGEVKLTAGEHEFELRLLAKEGEKKTACFDAFVLIRGPFTPRGRMKPDAKSGKAEPGFFAWEPDPDPLSDDCPIDLRRLNEKVAGQDGFVKRKGFDLVLGSGRRVRFWMVQGSVLLPMSHKEIDWWARRLAKYGVNLVRIEASPWTRKGGPDDIDTRKIDQIHYVVAALKKQGIYTYLGHVFWANWHISSARGFPPGYNNRACHGLLEFSDRMREIYYAWAKALMSTRNPYTGVPLAREPAIAVYEIQNEDSIFFWTFNPARMPRQTRELAEKQFARWLVDRYGSLAKARKAWGPANPPSRFYKQAGADDWDKGIVKLYGIGHLTGQAWAVKQRNPRRASDQLRFMVNVQKRSYDAIIRYLRKELGVRSMIACSNWKTADARVLDTFERYTYSGGDVICRNDYFGVRYDPKPRRFYAVDVGDTYRDESGLKVPERVPLQLNQLVAYPHMITENNWDRPSRFRVEWPFLIATYGSLCGIDGWNFFALSASSWDSSMRVWGINDTTTLAQFPAAALVFRRGYVKEAPTVMREALVADEQYAFKGTAIRETQGMDELWQKMVGADKVRQGQSPAAIDPLAFFVGRVERSLSRDKFQGLVRDLRPYIDRGNRMVRSITGELAWDFGRGVVTLNTPMAQGACGFLSAAGRIILRNVVIESKNGYASIMVVSLDGKPLAKSGRILIQAGTEDHPYGFSTQPAQSRKFGTMKRITALGGYPLNVRRVQARILLKRVSAGRAVVLDGNGYPTDRIVRVAKTGKGVAVQLPEDALYTMIGK